MKVFLETSRYLKKELPGILIAFSTDKLDYVSHDNASNNNEIACQYRDEFNSYLPKNKEDLALIDIYGMDLYTSKDKPSESLNSFRIKLQGLSLLAKEHDKIAAITEAGNRRLPSEDDARQPSINYFNDYLFKWITAKNVHVSYAVIWQNWSNNRDRKAVDPDDGYFTPINKNSDSGKDFIKYVEKKQSIMLEEFQTEIKRYKKE